MILFAAADTSYEEVIEKGSSTTFTFIVSIIILEFSLPVFLMILLEVIQKWERRLEYIKRMYFIANLLFIISILFLKFDSIFLGVLKFYFHFLFIAPLRPQPI